VLCDYNGKVIIQRQPDEYSRPVTYMYWNMKSYVKNKNRKLVFNSLAENRQYSPTCFVMLDFSLILFHIYGNNK